jgi:methyl-accepting chemotaxis protein
MGIWPLTLLAAIGCGFLHWRFSLIWRELELEQETRLLQRLEDHAQGKAAGSEVAAKSKSLHHAEELVEQARQRWVVPRQAQERQAQLIAALIDATPSAIVYLDVNGQVGNINQAARHLFRAAENTIQSQQPDFSAARLEGCPLLERLGHPELLATKENPATTSVNLSIGKATFRITSCALRDDNRQQLGTITEWLDNSAQINAEQQVQKLIGRAVSGNLDERLELEGMVGFMRGLGKGINMLMDAVQSPLQAIKDVQIGLAEGNLTKQMDGLFLGEFGSVQNATNQSIRQLTGLVEKVRASANAVEQAANALRQGNDLLKQRTNQQVDALDDAASAVEELTSTVKNNAENSHTANEHANNAHHEAERGRDEAQRACVAMENIKQSSQEISRVVSVIDEIAFRTKLLSLNAAVEAAHAGEKGRGFTVVAAEVRTLAERSAEAAKEISTLTAQSIKRIEEG